MRLFKNLANNIFPQHYLFYLSLIIVLGFVFSPGSVDYAEMKTSGQVAQFGKAFRVVTVLIAGYLSFLSLSLTRRLEFILKGHLAFLFYYFCMATASIVYSQYWQMTAFKSFEILTIVLMAATLYISSNPEKVSRQYVHFIFSIYVLIAISTWAQFAIFGVEAQRQLRHATPFFNFMLTSLYPFMVGNAVGYLGALVCLFGFYLSDTHLASHINNKVLGGMIIILGFATTVFSYTRSALIFLIGAIGLYCFLCRKNRYFIFGSISIGMAILFYPQIYQNLLLHLQRGDSLDALTSMSGRTNLWGDVLNQNATNLFLGRGFATGSLFKDFEQTGTTLRTVNVHNTMLEIVNYIGIIGLTIWLFLVASLGQKLCLFYRKKKTFARRPDSFLHNFIFSVFVLSICRAMMNVSFARLDLFMFVLLAIILYCDNLPSFSKNRNNQI